MREGKKEERIVAKKQKKTVWQQAESVRILKQKEERREKRGT
jgi:hypothetical protein